MASRRRHLHRCAHHADSIARGRCEKCGRWLCPECVVITGGRFFCKGRCGVPPAIVLPVAPPPEAAPPQAIPPSRRFAFPRITPYRAVSLGTFFICLGLVGYIIVMHRELTLEQKTRVEAEIAQQALEQRVAILQSELEHLRQELTPKPVTTTNERQRNVQYKPLDPGTGISRYTSLPRSFDNGVTSEKIVALTFDGGSYDNATPMILDTLASRGVSATMFLTGEFMSKHTETVRRIVAAGHEVGNHTYSHLHLTLWERNNTNETVPGMTRDKLAFELKKAEERFQAITGSTLAPLWRAPYGEWNNQLCAWGAEAGYLHVGWRKGRTWRENLDSNDWIPTEETAGYHSPEEVLSKILALADNPPYGINGGIILFHLGTERNQPSQQVHRALGKLIDELRSRGYSFSTVTKLALASGIDLSQLPVQE